MSDTNKQYRKLAEELHGPNVGCQAAVCVFGRADGMTLQGPCTCHNDRQNLFRLALMAKAALERQAVQS